MTKEYEHRGEPLWECPCRECWKMEQDLLKSSDDTIHMVQTYPEWVESIT